MEFYELLPGFDFYNRRGASFTPEEFLSEAKRQIAEQRHDAQQRSVEFDRFNSEHHWTMLGRPYFKVWPGVLPLLTNVSVDVPTEYLRLPFSAFVLRLHKEDNPLVVDEQHHVRSILVVEGENSRDERAMLLWIDIGETESTGLAMLHWSILNCQLGETVERAFGGERTPDLPGVRIPDELSQRCLRLAVSVAFLSTGMDRLIEPDVLSKDLAAYLEAKKKSDDQRIRTIEDRAVRRGKRGWNVGQSERFRPMIGRSHSGEQDGSPRGELSHQHQRRAHFRALPSGQVIFIRQATVRPDLPPPEQSPAYQVK